MVFNHDQLQFRLRDYYADQTKTGENLRIEDFSPMNSGWASDVYAFTLRYEESGETITQNLVLKTYADTFDGKDRALKERHALFNLRANRYPVPGVSAVEIDPIHLGQPFVVMEHIPGRMLWEVFETADEDGRTDLMRLFVGLLADLHTHPIQQLAPNVKITSEYTLINREIYALRNLIKEYNRTEFEPIADWLYEHRQNVPCDQPAIGHRDFHPWNVLLTEQGRMFVIDWGWQIADPRYDVAWMLTLMERSGYQAFRDEALAEYERATERPFEHLDYFEVLAHTRWLLEVTNSLLFGVNLRDGSLMEFRALIADQVRYTANVIEARIGIALPVDTWL
ncbi:MAG: phosphotransferase [Anaerolineae bacterium]|nr:phosphotransferase [Anaerolineae bacterium]